MEGQVWLVVAVLSIVGFVTCSASAKPQLVYNSDGTPRLQIINGGPGGQPLQGRMSWQTPEGKSVWIQYPINHQGFVSWTPAEYTYSVSSGATRNAFNVDERVIHLNTPIVNPARYQQQRLRTDRRIETQITNNNDQSTVLGHNLHEEGKFTGRPLTDKLHGPVMEKFPGPASDIVHGPVFQKFPGSASDIVHGPVFERVPGTEMDKIHGPVFEKFPGRETDIVHGPVFEKLPSSISDKVHGPVFERFPSTLSDKLHGPVMQKFPGRVRDRFNVPTESPVEVFTGRTLEDEDSTNEEVVPVTESLFENYVINELDTTDFVERDDQIEDTTELGPLVRLTSRGRPQISNKFSEKQKSKTRKQSIRPRPNNPPVPSLIIDPSLRQTYTRTPSNRVNSENRFRTRRPGITNQQRRVNPGIRRDKVTDNGIARLLTPPEEESNRGVARSRPASLILNKRYSRVSIE